MLLAELNYNFMARIIKGKNKGKKCRVHQHCNDWFSVQLEDGSPLIVSPTVLQFNLEEVKEIESNKNNGFLFNMFQLTEDLRFKKIKK